MNRSDLSRRQRAIVLDLKGSSGAMKSETPAQRYRRQAEECELNADKTTNGADREAWNRLAADWKKLALGSELLPERRQTRH